jgi:hypothetical protein
MVKQNKIFKKQSNKNSNIKNSQSKESSQDLTKQSNKTSGLTLKKEKINVNSKLKKKLKFTQKKLDVENEKLLNSIKAIKTEAIGQKKISSNKNKKKIQELDDDHDLSDLHENLYLYVFLKNKNSENNTNEKIKELKSKLIKLPVRPMNETNQQKICLVDDNLLNEKPKNIENQKNQKNSEKNLNEDLCEKILNKLCLDEEIEDYVEVLSTEEFINQLKSSPSEITNQFHSFILGEKLRTRVNQIVKSKDNKTFSLNALFYNKQKYGKKIFEYLKKLITIVTDSCPLNIEVSKNLGVIKVGNTGMQNSDLLKNTKISLFKIISLLLTVSEKYTGVKCVVLKSENSLPYELIDTLSPEDLEAF